MARAWPRGSRGWSSTPPRCSRSSASASRRRRLGAGGSVGDDLGQHRVEVDADHRAGLDTGVPPHGRRRRRARTRRACPWRAGTRPPGPRRRGAPRWRAPVQPDVGLAVAERLARGDAELLAHQVDAGDRLGDRVLDLEPGVHLEEEELAGGVVDEELDRARRLVAERPGERAGRRRPWRLRIAASTTGDGDSSMIFWWRRWIEHSRSPRCTRSPCGVAEDLDLDVAGAGHVALEEHPVVAERRLAPPGAPRRRPRSSSAGVADDRACPCRRRRPRP